MSALPISRQDSDAAADEFLKHWTPQKLAKVGLHQMVRDLFYELQDHGDIIVLTVNEGHALSEWLCENDIGMDVHDADCSLSPELKSAVKKVEFANARCFGLMNIDMGIEEPDE